MAILTNAPGNPGGLNMLRLWPGTNNSGPGYTVVQATATVFEIQLSGVASTVRYTGTGFTFSGSTPTGGTYTQLERFSAPSGSGGALWQTLSGLTANLADITLATADDLALTGADTLNGTALGSEVLFGRGGDDTYVILNASTQIDELAGGGTDTVQSALASYFLGANVENLTGTAASAQTLTGNTLANTITAGGGNDTIRGGNGVDSLHGGLGNDVIHVGYSVDPLFGLLAADQIGAETIDGGGGFDTLRIELPSSLLGVIGLEYDFSSATITSIEQLQLSSATFLAGGIGPYSSRHIFSASQVGSGLSPSLFILASGPTPTFIAEGITFNMGAATSLSLSGFHFDAGWTNGTDRIDIVGDGDAETIVGSSGSDSITSGGGNDTLVGSEGGDTMIGGLGDDTYYTDPTDTITELAGQGSDTIAIFEQFYTLVIPNVENLTGTRIGTTTQSLTGNALNNIIAASAGLMGAASLNGGAGLDTLYGGSGNDELDGGTGDDSMIGGLGNDAFKVDSAGDIVVEATGGGRDVVVSVIATTSLVGWENVEDLRFDSPGAHTGTGNDSDNTIFSNGSPSGNQNFYGGNGNDTLFGNGGDDTLDGGADNDSLFGDFGNDSLIGGAGNDTLTGGGGGDTMDGGQGDDVYRISIFTVANGPPTILELSNGGVDRIEYSTDPDGSSAYTMATNIENLTVIVTQSSGAANIIGNAMDNVIETSGGSNNSRYTFAGLEGNDHLIGNSIGFAGYNLYGGNGNDTLSGGDVADILDGGDGDDALNGLFGNDSLTGGSGNDSLYAGSNNDTLDGGDGDDVLRGETGNDSIDGGSNNATGADMLDLSDAFSAVVHILGLGGTGSITLAVLGTDTYTGIEGLIGGAFADSITGNGDANTLAGGLGNDTLHGGDGNDNISGDGGADFMYGGIGDDRFVVDTYAGEAVVEFANEGTDVVYATIDYTVGANIEQIIMVEGSAAVNAGGGDTDNVIIGNSAANVIYAYGGNDVISGGDGDDSLLGMDGNDAIDGQGGNDQMIGGLGDDSFVINSISDAAAEFLNEGIDTVYAEIDYTLGGNIEQLILREGTAAVNGAGDANNNTIIGNSAINTIYGNDGADTLYGFANNDVLVGGNGNDIFDGGTGNDNLSGNADADLFKFAAGDGLDVINDFSHAEGDRLVISTALAADFAAFQAAGSTINGNAVFSFGGGTQTITLAAVNHTSLVAADVVFY